MEHQKPKVEKGLYGRDLWVSLSLKVYTQIKFIGDSQSL